MGLTHPCSLDTDVAPLWDPELRSFVGLMVVQDYITAMRLCLGHNMSIADNPAPSPSSNPKSPVNALEITSKPISEILMTIPQLFSNQGFHAVDVEDTVLQLFTLLMKTHNDYAPVVDPETSSLVSILGMLDIVHLLNQIAKNNTSLFGESVGSLGVGTYSNVLTMTKNALIFDVLNLIHQHQISAVPIVDDVGRIVGIYHKSDVSFIMKAQDPESVLTNLKNFRIEHSLVLKEQLLASGELITNVQGLATCKSTDSMLTVINLLEMNRTNRVVIIDDNRLVQGIVTTKDLLNHYIDNVLSPR